MDGVAGTAAQFAGQFQEELSKLDQDGDGQIDASEIVAMADMDGDGKLDAEELQVIAERFNDQIKVSNGLLKQVQVFEEKLLESSRDIQKKQSSLRDALGACDAAQDECAEYKKKLGVQSEVAQGLRDECKQLRTKMGSKDREVDQMKKINGDLKAELDMLKQERESLASQNEDLTSKMADTKAKMLHDQQLEFQRDAEATAAREEMERQIADLTQRNGPLAETLTLKEEALAKTTLLLEEKSKMLETVAREKESALNKVEDTSERFGRLQADYNALKETLEEKHANEERLGAESDTHKDLHNQVAMNLHSAEEREAQLKETNGGLMEELESQKQEIESLGTELLNQAQARLADQERWESKLLEMKNQTTILRVQMQEAEQRNDMEMKMKEQEEAKARQEQEEQYVALQSEHTQLHHLLQKMQQDSMVQFRGFEEERATHEKQVRILKERANESDTKMGGSQVQFTAEKAQLNTAIVELRREAAEKSAQNADALAAMKGVMDEVAMEYAQRQEEYTAISSEFVRIQARIHEIGVQTAEPVQKWHDEVSETFASLVKQSNKLRTSEKSARDDLRVANGKYETERQQKLLLQDSVTDLEHQLEGSLTETKRMVDTKQNELERSMRGATETKGKAKELEHQVKAANANLAEQQRRARELQVENQRMKSELAEARSNHGAGQKSLETKVDELELAVRTLTNERESMEMKTSSAEKSSNSANEALRQAKEKRGELESMLERMTDQTKATIQKLQRNIRSLSDSQQALQEQLTSKTKLMGTRQERIDELTRINMQLEQDLAGAFKAKMDGHAANGLGATQIR
jgi:chromosome segregation ATPase